MHAVPLEGSPPAAVTSAHGPCKWLSTIWNILQQSQSFWKAVCSTAGRPLKGSGSDKFHVQCSLWTQWHTCACHWRQHQSPATQKAAPAASKRTEMHLRRSISPLLLGRGLDDPADVC